MIITGAQTLDRLSGLTRKSGYTGSAPRMSVRARHRAATLTTRFPCINGGDVRTRAGGLVTQCQRIGSDAGPRSRLPGGEQFLVQDCHGG
jgi:hypothetical protein